MSRFYTWCVECACAALSPESLILCTCVTRLCPSAGVEHYNEIKDISICEFLVPHLVIYMDRPAEEVQKKLKASGKVRHDERRLLQPSRNITRLEKSH